MAFLEDFTTEKKSPPEDASDDEDFKIDIKQEFDHTAASTAVQSNSSNSASTLEDPNPPKRTKLEDHHCSSYDNTTVLHLLQEIREMINSRSNPISIFFDSMAKTVMQFPPAQAAEVKLKVCQIVTEMECKLLEESGNYPENLENFQ